MAPYERKRKVAEITQNNLRILVRDQKQRARPSIQMSRMTIDIRGRVLIVRETPQAPAGLCGRNGAATYRMILGILASEVLY